MASVSKKQAAWKRYYAKHKERLKERCKERYHATKEETTPAKRRGKKRYLKGYYQENKEKWAERRRRLREEINAEKRRRYKENEDIRDYYKRQARAWKAKNPSKALAHDLAAYGMSLDEYQELIKRQGRRCAICGAKQNGRRLSVDHCHVSKKVRGLLCSSCNFGLGIFKDNPKLLLKAVAYLRRDT